MKQNKLIKYSLIAIVLFVGLFSINVDVYAGACDNYTTKCITCKTTIGQDSCNYDVTFTVVADGNGGADIKSIDKKKNFTGNERFCSISLESNLSGSDFINDYSTTLICPPSSYYSVTAGQGGTSTYTIQTQETNNKVLFEKIEDNKKNFKNTTNDSITCTYSGKDSTSGNKVADIKITTNGESISTTATNGYKISTVTSISSSLFIDSSGNLFCPNNSFHIICGSSYNNKFCSLIEGEDIRGNTSSPVENGEEESDSYGTENANCGIFVEVIPYLEQVFIWIRILVPIALICFGFIDFTTPILSSDKDALSKATSKFIKRCIIAIIIFFVPTIVSLLLNIYNEVTGVDASTCGLNLNIITKLWW